MKATNGEEGFNLNPIDIMPQSHSPILESCITSYPHAISAAENGATRLEICINIEQDGLTPPVSMINQIIEAVRVPIRVLVRPRAGDFIYTTTELEKYYKEIEIIAALDIEGIVIGALDTLGMPNLDFVQRARYIVGHKKIVFHKAVDITSDIIQATQLLSASGLVDGILSSGGKSKASEGLSTLLAMKDICEPHVELVAAGKITYDNREEIHAKLGLRSYHGRKIVPTLSLQ